MQRAKTLLETGGAKVAELDALLAEVEQFGWGPAEVQADVAPLEERLKEAKIWVGQVRPVHPPCFHLCVPLTAKHQMLACAHTSLSSPLAPSPTHQQQVLMILSF